MKTFTQITIMMGAIFLMNTCFATSYYLAAKKQTPSSDNKVDTKRIKMLLSSKPSKK